MNIWYYTHRKTVIRVFFAVVFFLEYFLAGFGNILRIMKLALYNIPSRTKKI